MYVFIYIFYCLLPSVSNVHNQFRALTWWCAVVFTGVSQGAASLVRAREGGSAELSCSLTPTSKEATTPNLFPLHVVEWVRLGFNVPVLIKFGVYAPRVHPNYKGKIYLEVYSYILLFLSAITWRSILLEWTCWTLLWMNLFPIALAIWLHRDPNVCFETISQ